MTSLSSGRNTTWVPTHNISVYSLANVPTMLASTNNDHHKLTKRPGVATMSASVGIVRPRRDKILIFFFVYQDTSISLLVNHYSAIFLHRDSSALDGIDLDDAHVIPLETIVEHYRCMLSDAYASSRNIPSTAFITAAQSRKPGIKTVFVSGVGSRVWLNCRYQSAADAARRCPK